MRTAHMVYLVMDARDLELSVILAVARELANAQRFAAHCDRPAVVFQAMYYGDGNFGVLRPVVGP